MHKLYSVCLGAFLALFSSISPVLALEPIVYVSGKGSDSKACTLAAPCRNFTRAINMVAGNGTIRVLDSASYGNATIPRSLTIDGGGNVVALGTRFTINRAGAVVTLRGLVMDGRELGTDLNGITISAASAVHIEDCDISSYSGIGIFMTSATKLFVSDTVSRDNDYGLSNNSSGAQVTIENSRFENNTRDGLHLAAAKVNVVHSVASGNNFGIAVVGGTANITETTTADNTSVGFDVGASGVVILTASVARGNFSGLRIGAPSTAIITDSVFTHNNYGIVNNGNLYTRQNSTLNWNITDYIVQGIGTKTAAAGF